MIKEQKEIISMKTKEKELSQTAEGEKYNVNMCPKEKFTAAQSVPLQQEPLVTLLTFRYFKGIHY